MNENSSDRKNEALFLQLVFTFQTAAWQQMGKIKNPITDKIERDLNQARFSIDMLEMIRTKTQGNLSEEEIKFLTKTISELQLNYVDEVNKEEKEKKEEKKEEAKEEKKSEGPENKTEAKDKKNSKKNHSD